MSSRSQITPRILSARWTELKRNVQVQNTKVKELLFEGDRVKGIRAWKTGRAFYNDDVVVATGGICRTRRRGRMETATVLRKAGLAVATPPPPGAGAAETEEAYIRELQGLLPKMTTMTIKNGKKTLV